uniref:Secreted protein n=1 Tax=Romanomermis culicivorax TaxID=13658 RepID=A0A915J7K7_ROMCU
MSQNARTLIVALPAGFTAWHVYRPSSPGIADCMIRLLPSFSICQYGQLCRRKIAARSSGTSCSTLVTAGVFSCGISN